MLETSERSQNEEYLLNAALRNAHIEVSNISNPEPFLEECFDDTNSDTSSFTRSIYQKLLFQKKMVLSIHIARYLAK